MVSGLAYNKVIEGRNYLYGDQFFDEPLRHAWNKSSYKGEVYFCDPSTWGLHLTCRIRTKGFNWLKKYTLHKVSEGPGNLVKKYVI